jgi:hypothetical protein
VGGEGIEPPTWSLGRGVAQYPAAVREVRAVGALVSALKTPKHRLMLIRTVSRCKWLTQNARETSLGSASKLRHLGSHQPRSLIKTLVNSGERLRNLPPTLAD